MASVEKTEDDGDAGLSLIDCLRGRLLAERQASRAAKDDAEFMVQKVWSLPGILFISFLYANLIPINGYEKKGSAFFFV